MKPTTTKKQANFFLSTMTLKDLKAHVPARKHSEFVELAILKELQQRKFAKILNAKKPAWKAKDHPEDTARFIRSLRDSNRI